MWCSSAGFSCFFLILLWLSAPAVASADELPYWIETVAGTSEVGDGGAALGAQLAGAEGLALDASGNLYIADNLDHRIRKVDVTTGTISTVAGSGHSGFAGDGEPATDALLDRPYGVAFANGNLYLADYGNGRVRRITAEGGIDTVAGGSSNGNSSGAVAARLLGPRNVAADAAGNLYISDFLDHRVYRVSPDGSIALFAGTGNAGYNGDGPATASDLDAPAGLAVDRQGTVYIADSGNNRIRRVADGKLETVLGTGTGAVQLFGPTGVAVDARGNLYVADSGNRRLLRWDASGSVVVLATAESIRDVAVDSAGRVFVAEGRRVFRILSDGTLMTVAGCGEFGSEKEGAPAVQTHLRAPVGVAVDRDGIVYIADEAGYRVRKVDLKGTLTTTAGTGEQGFSGDGGPAPAAGLVDPVAVTSDSSRNVWIADYLGHRVRRVSPSGVITSAAGTGRAGFSGDTGPAASARLNRPRGVATDVYGNVYIADSLNHRVRKVDRRGSITTVAGTGIRGHSGDRGLATLAQLDTPAAVTVDDEGNLYIAEQGSHVIRMVRPDGFILAVAGTGVGGYSGDGGPATTARLDSPSGVAADSRGNLFIADTNNHRVRRVTPDGTIDSVAGTGTPGFGGDRGPAAEAQLRQPSAVVVDRVSGALYVADTANRRVRKLTQFLAPPPVIEPPEECEVLHAASFRPGPVAPGQLVSVFAEGVGPAQSISAQFSSSGLVANSLAGTEVRVNGVPAPLLFAGGEQLNVQIPYAVAGSETAELEVWVEGRLHSRAALEVWPAAPGLFSERGGAGQILAINEDGSLNSTDNPAGRGSVVVFYATGEGQTDSPGIDGQPATAPYPRPLLAVEVRISGLPVEILYAGAAPSFVGLMQVNARIPPAFIPSGNLKLELFVGGASSQPAVTIAVR